MHFWVHHVSALAMHCIGDILILGPLVAQRVAARMPGNLAPRAGLFFPPSGQRLAAWGRGTGRIQRLAQCSVARVGDAVVLDGRLPPVQFTPDKTRSMRHRKRKVLFGWQ
jgi:hypothetical protein